MKSHKKLVITRKMLEDIRYACSSGLDAVNHLFPITISTEPLDNLDVADQLVSIRGNPYWTPDDVAGSVFLLGADTPVLGIVGRAGRGGGDDPYLVAQTLAAAADAYLTARGK